MGDRITISGDIHNSIVNIKSPLKDVQQSAGAMPGSDEAARKQLQSLIEQLGQALAAPQVQESKKDEAEAVAASAQLLVESAKAEKPNKTLLQSSGEVLKKAAETLVEVAPGVVSIAGQIVAAVLHMKGLA
jgi:hypothetical protein